MNKITTCLTGALSLLLSSAAWGLALDKLTLPAGFTIAVYAHDVTNARQMALGDNGVVYVGSRGEGKVHAVIDEDRDGTADKVVLVADGLTMPSGVAYRNGDLYVSEVSRIVKFANIDKTYGNKPALEVVIDGLPSEIHHGWKNIAFGPDNWLYVPVGAPCNICQTLGGEKFDDPVYASILKFNIKTGEKRWVAKGVRNSVGFDWHPESKEFWFSDNGRDMMGDDIPPCEINRVSEDGQHFGYPYFHGGDVPDPEFSIGKNKQDYVAPALKLNAHVAPLGILFYQGSQYPASYKNNLFVAEHGSWNRTKKSGYRVMMANIKDNKVQSYTPFIEGFLNPDDSAWGRPVAMLTLPDGSMLISDDFANVIYRVTYK
ncbi:PQQ-dependent sugar dehydrogenase [Aliiglaciecola sp. LCG003]|uniref:PQQ-dependent sugar dehydrogenase n=1 Tax=Aliiglaciecola sp. LCG003 TaxID=3053655 RepID=UPI002574818D|nr:PQQ-dependent sugar dehydrogenase [Aliiglaciecola sp. LCG003]WJG09994.1 PQQ-dependent sugar dehydrogenase [Aliiglaciecola sp. LCG003]